MKKINLKSWRVARWVAVFHIIPLGAFICMQNISSAILSLTLIILWLLIDSMEGHIDRLTDGWRECNSRWFDYCREGNKEWKNLMKKVAEGSALLEKENAELKDENEKLRDMANQLARLKSIHHIKDTEEENIKPMI